MKKILIALDGSSNSMKALAQGKKIAAAFDANIILIYAVDTPIRTDLMERMYLETLEKASKEYGQKVIDKALEELKDFSGKASGFVKVGNPAEIIINTASEENAELIVMGSRGLSGIERLMIGSISNKVLNNTDISVLIVK
jgi:nucleotide-binding universal stress UspA family protein